MKSSLLSETDSPADGGVATDRANLPAVSQPTALVPDKFFSNSEMEGDFDSSDFKVPKLNLVQGVGPLTEFFQPGHWVYAKEIDLGQSTVELTLLKMRKYFVEDIPYGSEQFPIILNTIDEVHKSGAFLSKEKRAMGEGHQYFKPTLDATVLLKGRPEDVVFPLDFNGTPYAMAIWTLSSVAFSRTATTLMTASQLGLRAGLTTGFWHVTPKREKVGTNFIWLPIARQAGKNTPEFQEFARSLLGSGNTQ